MKIIHRFLDFSRKIKEYLWMIKKPINQLWDNTIAFLVKIKDNFPVFENKITYQTIIAFIALMIAFYSLLYISGIIPKSPSPVYINLSNTPTTIISNLSEKTDLNVKLVLDNNSQYITITNIGSNMAINTKVHIESWADKAPQASILFCKKISSLLPKTDIIIPLEVNLYNHGGTYYCNEKEIGHEINTSTSKGFEWDVDNATYCRSSSSGYIDLICDNCVSTRRWIFHIPSENGYFINQTDNIVPIIEIGNLSYNFYTMDLSEKFNFGIAENEDYLNSRARSYKGPKYDPFLYDVSCE